MDKTFLLVACRSITSQQSCHTMVSEIWPLALEISFPQPGLEASPLFQLPVLISDFFAKNKLHSMTFIYNTETLLLVVYSSSKAQCILPAQNSTLAKAPRYSFSNLFLAEDSPLTFPAAEVTSDLFLALRQGSRELPPAPSCHDQAALRWVCSNWKSSNSDSLVSLKVFLWNAWLLTMAHSTLLWSACPFALLYT